MKAIVRERPRLLLVVVGTLLLFASAQIQIPFYPVPVTLQTFAVLLIALVFERKAALGSMISYLGLGALGLPVFTGFKNAMLLGPTMGYLVGFAVAIWALTTMRSRFGEPKSWLALFGYSLLGSSLIYIAGVLWLAGTLGFQQAIAFGFLPFIIPGIVKASILAAAIRFLRS